MQLDVHQNPDDPAGHTPYLLNVQHDLLDNLDSRVVIPLIRTTAFGQPVRGLHPVVTVAGEDVVLATHQIAAIRSADLGKTIGTLTNRRDEILRAIDILWSGV